MYSIIAVNAICADPVKTWSTTRDHQPYQWIQRLAQDEIPTARVLLYDHLEPAERAIELEAVGHPEHKASAKAHAVVQGLISKFGIEEWTERFMKALHGWRETKAVCHISSLGFERRARLISIVASTTATPVDLS